MELLIEFILELILEGSIEIIKIKKVPKFIRYSLIILIGLFFSLIIFGMLSLGFILLKENFYMGLFIILITITLLICGVFKLKKVYQEYKCK